jgi:hypothetical protein
VVLPGATPDIRQGRGADDAVLNANGTPHIRQGRGADDVVVAGAAPDIRQGRGADDIVTSALVPTLAAITKPAPVATAAQAGKGITFGASQKPDQTTTLTASATTKTSGKVRILDVSVQGFIKIPTISTANLENGQVMGNLPEKARWRFALYANAQQAQAAAALWAAPAATATRTDRAVSAAETGIVVWDEKAESATDDSSKSQGAIHGLVLRSDRMTNLSASFLKGKIIQIYGPLVEQKDETGKVISSKRDVYWTSNVIR